MYLWNKKGVISLCLVFLLLAGCQPVNGFDPIKWFEKELEVTSYEGSLSLKIDFDIEADDTKKPFDLYDYRRGNLEDYKLLNGLQLNLNDLKVDVTRGKVSGKGSLSKPQLNIPFEFSTDGDKTVLQVEGAKHPITVKSWRFLGQAPYTIDEYSMLSKPPVSLPELGGKRERELAKKGLGLLVRNLPNTDSLTIEKNKSIAIHGTQASGTAMAFDVTGEQLPDLFKKYVRSMTFDDKGLKELADGIYGYLQEEKSIGDDFKEWFADKEVSVEGIYGVEKFVLAYLSSFGAAKGKDFRISPNTRVHLDLFADDQQLARKMNLDIQLKDEQALADGVKGGRLQLSVERWNINGNVQPVDVGAQDAVDVSKLKTPEELLDQVNEPSDLYKFLKNELKVTHRQFSIWLMKKDDFEKAIERYKEISYSPGDGFISEDIAYGQVRRIAEELGYKVEWDSGNEAVVVKTGKKELRFTPNSSLAIVDGKEVEMGSPAQLIHGVYFVPVRFLVEQLGGEVHWIQDRPNRLYITKD